MANESIVREDSGLIYCTAFKFLKTLILDKENVIIVGHTRFEAAKILGLEKVPVVIADLPKNKAKANRILIIVGFT